MPKTVFQTDFAGLYVGETLAYEDPMDPTSYLIPGGAVEVPPPVHSESEQPRWVGTFWIVEERPAVDLEPSTPEDAPVAPDRVPPQSEPESEPEPPADNELVNRERLRRFLLGCVVYLNDYTLVRVTGDEETVRNLQSKAFGSQIRRSQGDESTTVWRDANDVHHVLTQSQVVELWAKAASYGESLYPASWALKELNPLPEDYDSDDRWPATSVGAPEPEEIPDEPPADPIFIEPEEPDEPDTPVEPDPSGEVAPL